MADLLAYSYQVLNAHPEMTDDELKRQYRIMVKKYHPDADPNSDEDEDFMRIQNAYEYVLVFRESERNRVKMPQNAPHIPKKNKHDASSPYAEAERMQQEYLRRQYEMQQRSGGGMPKNTRISRLEFMGLHTFFLILISSTSFIAFILYLENMMRGAIFMGVITLYFLMKKSWEEFQLDWPLYFRRLLEPKLRNAIIFYIFLGIFNIFMLVKVMFYTVFPVSYYVLSLLFIGVFGYILRKSGLHYFSLRTQHILTLSIQLFFLINMFFTIAPWKDVTLELNVISTPYSNYLEYKWDDESHYYKQAYILSILPHGLVDVQYAIFQTRKGALGLDLVTRPLVF